MTTHKRIQATENAISILDVLEKREGVGVTEIAQEVDLSKSAIYNQLKTMEELSLVRQSGTEYHLGARLLDYGFSYRNQSELYRAARGKLAELANATDETVNLIVPEGNNGVCLAQVVSADLHDTLIGEGESVPLVETAGGIKILSHRNEREQNSVVNAYVEHGETTESERKNIEELLRKAEEQNVLLTKYPYDSSYHGAAVSIGTPSSDLRGAIEVVGPKDRLTGNKLEVEVVGMVADMARQIETSML